MPLSRAARMNAVSAEATERSFQAIRDSLDLLRKPVYPEALPAHQPVGSGVRPIPPEEEGRRDVDVG